MTEYPIPDAVLVHHAAFLGKTRSGKTSSAKTAVERFVAAGERVCILDPIKSDWWGLTSSADGTEPGLPFRILGGPHGHIPLPSSSGAVIGELVATGALPLSIVDMADFEAGGLQRWFSDFAHALMRKQRGVLHLVIEEAHEFAPKERAGIGDENMAIHWAKKLATAGGSKGIRLIVATQRTQALHNAILGSCETLVAHRLTAPADQKPVVDWLKANVEKGLAAEIAGSLASLPTGTAWVCSGEAQMFARVEFPRIATFDNSATPLSDDEAGKVRTAAVDVDALRDLVGAAVAEAEANDPKKLKAEVARLTKALEAKASSATPEAANSLKSWATVDLIDELEQRDPEWLKSHPEFRSAIADRDEWMAKAERYDGCIKAAARALGYRDIEEISAEIEDRRWADGLKPAKGAGSEVKDKPSPHSRSKGSLRPAISQERRPATLQSDSAVREGPPHGAPAPASGIPASQQRVLDAIAWWRAIGIDPVERNRASVIAGLSPRASTFGVYVSKLAAAALVDTSTPGMVSLTDAGWEKARPPGTVDRREVVNQARSMLSPAASSVFDKIVAHYPRWVGRGALADECGLSRTASTLGVYISKASGLGFVETRPGEVRAADWMMP